MFAIAAAEDTIYVGGEFTYLGGEYRTNLAALRADTGTALPWRADANNAIHALALSGDSLMAGGKAIDGRTGAAPKSCGV